MSHLKMYPRIRVSARSTKSHDASVLRPLFHSKANIPEDVAVNPETVVVLTEF